MCHSLAALQPAKTNEKRGKTIKKYHWAYISTSTGLQFDPACLMSSELICLLGEDDFAFEPDCCVSTVRLLELRIILLLLCVCCERAMYNCITRTVWILGVSILCATAIQLLVLGDCYCCQSCISIATVEPLHAILSLSKGFTLHCRCHCLSFYSDLLSPCTCLKY